jgi:hypothetical protein
MPDKKSKNIIAGTIPPNVEELEFWISFAKQQVISTQTVYFETIKIFLQVSSISLTVFLGSVALAGNLKIINNHDFVLILPIVFCFIITIVISTISILGGAYEFDILIPETIEAWYLARLNKMRKRTKIITAFFLTSLILMSFYWFFLLYRLKV